MSTVQSIWKAKAELGEGVRYDPVENEIWWVDILGQKIFCLNLDTGKCDEWPTPEPIGYTVKRQNGTVLALLKNSIVELDRATGTFQTFLTFPSEPQSNRFNDGAIDAQGNFWAGSMDFNFQEPTGVLYRVDKNRNIAVADSGYIVINGPAFSPDGQTLYVNDTMKGQIFSYDFDIPTGTLSNKKLFATIDASDGFPDGITVDSNGGVWVALVTGGCVRHYSPDGRIDGEIKLPTPTVTSVCFGGKDNKTLFITTGRILMEPEVLEAHPLSGSLFMVDVNVAGQPTTDFAG